MLLFSPGGRQVIDAAVAQFEDPHGREVWQRWAAQNPRTRRAGDPWDDGGPPLPHEIVEVALRHSIVWRGRKVLHASIPAPRTKLPPSTMTLAGSRRLFAC
jgi:hypothetical protein